jgi:putative endonuclease
MYFTYVLHSLKDKNFYIGFTDNLTERIKEHKIGKVKSTKYRLPVVLIYYECCVNKFDAIKRERYLKSGMGKRYIKNRLKNYLKEKAAAS